MKAIILAALLTTGFSLQTMAYPRHGGYGRGGGHHGGYHGGGHHHDGGDYDDGVLAGLLMSTSLLFISDITTRHSEAVYLYADQDAATYLAEGGQPSPALTQAMKYERGFLARAQVEGADQLSDQEIAYLVMKRAESL